MITQSTEATIPARSLPTTGRSRTGASRRLAHSPVEREGRVEEMAYANLFLASDEASCITSVELPVDDRLLAR